MKLMGLGMLFDEGAAVANSLRRECKVVEERQKTKGLGCPVAWLNYVN